MLIVTLFCVINCASITYQYLIEIVQQKYTDNNNPNKSHTNGKGQGGIPS